MPVIWYILIFHCVPDSQPEKNNLSPLSVGTLNTFWFLPFKLCLQQWLELTYLSLLSVLWDQPLLFTYFCSLMIVPCSHLWFPWGICTDYTVTLWVSCTSFCPGPVTQTDWTEVYRGFFRSVREECSKIYNRSKTDKLSNISKDSRNCPMGFSMKAGMVQNISVINSVILY